MLKRVYCAIFLFFFCMIILAIPYNSHGKVNARISLVSGKVFVNGKLVKVGDSVIYGDEIRTDHQSACEIMIDNNSIIRIQNNAKLIFHVTETENSFIELIKGWLSMVSKKRNLTVKTPTAIAGVRGTALCIKVGDPESTYACTCNGTIHWKEKGDDKEEVISANHHAGRHYKLIDGKVVSKPLGKLYHTDQDIEALAAKINVKIDWTKARD